MAKKPSKSFEITLSALACALSAGFLALGTLNIYMLATGYIMGEIALMLPLARKFFVGDVLAYVGTVILAVILGAVGQIWALVPFIMFFGLHPLMNSLQEHFKIGWFIALPIKAVWFDFTLWVAYILVFHNSIGNPEWEFYDILNEWILLFIFIGGSIIFIAYDWAMTRGQRAVDALIAKIKRDK